MRARYEALALLAGSGVADFALRITQVALPLVILHETGSVAATGLVGGAAGVPVLLSPWWARKARQWVDSGPRLAVVAMLSGVGSGHRAGGSRAQDCSPPSCWSSAVYCSAAAMLCPPRVGRRCWLTPETGGVRARPSYCSPGRTDSAGSG